MKEITLNFKAGGKDITTKTSIVLLKSLIDLKIESNLVSGSIGFLDTLILDGSTSLDPDYPTDKLSYNWLCSSYSEQIRCKEKY